MEYSVVLPNGVAWIYTLSQRPQPGDLLTHEDGPLEVLEVVGLPRAPRPVIYVVRAGPPGG